MINVESVSWPLYNSTDSQVVKNGYLELSECDNSIDGKDLSKSDRLSVSSIQKQKNQKITKNYPKRTNWIDKEKDEDTLRQVLLFLGTTIHMSIFNRILKTFINFHFKYKSNKTKISILFQCLMFNFQHKLTFCDLESLCYKLNISTSQFVRGEKEFKNFCKIKKISADYNYLRGFIGIRDHISEIILIINEIFRNITENPDFHEMAIRLTKALNKCKVLPIDGVKTTAYSIIQYSANSDKTQVERKFKPTSDVDYVEFIHRIDFINVTIIYVLFMLANKVEPAKTKTVTKNDLLEALNKIETTSIEDLHMITSTVKYNYTEGFQAVKMFKQESRKRSIQAPFYPDHYH